MVQPIERPLDTGAPSQVYICLLFFFSFILYRLYTPFSFRFQAGLGGDVCRSVASSVRLACTKANLCSEVVIRIIHVYRT